MNFEPKYPESVAQLAILNLIVFQIRGQYQFNYLDQALLLVDNLAR